MSASILDPRMIDPSKPLTITGSVAISSLNARAFTLVHDPANDGIDPIFDIGETLTGSFSGFRLRYEEPTNRLIGSSRTGTTILTSFMINTVTGQVGVSGLPVADQALTVNGSISATALLVSTPVIANYDVVTVTSSRTFTNADNSKVFHFNTTSSSLCAIFPSTLSNGFNVGIINVGTGTVVLSSDVTINAPGTQNSTPYSGMFIYEVNNTFFGVGVFD